MVSHLLISIISDDKPGIVEALAEAVAAANGNWLESRLSQLGGKFAGVIRVSVAQEQLAPLEQKLRQLESQQIWVKTERAATDSAKTAELGSAYIHALGPDRPGIVKELSKALVKNHINLANLETALSSMPYSGDPLFEATGQLEIPPSVDMQALRQTLDAIADALALDISLSEQPFEH